MSNVYMGFFSTVGAAANLKVGDKVYIRRGLRTPYGGRSGVVIAIDMKDIYGTHLVSFDDGLCFRYWLGQLKLLQSLDVSVMQKASGQ